MHEKGLVVCCMFDCIPRGTYFIPSDNAVRIIDYSASLYNIPYIAILLLMNLRLIIFCFFSLKVNSWVEDEVMLLKYVDLYVFFTTLLFFGGLSARDVPPFS